MTCHGDIYMLIRQAKEELMRATMLCSFKQHTCFRVCKALEHYFPCPVTVSVYVSGYSVALVDQLKTRIQGLFFPD